MWRGRFGVVKFAVCTIAVLCRIIRIVYNWYMGNAPVSDGSG